MGKVWVDEGRYKVKVYVVHAYEYGDHVVFGVFSTVEDAERYAIRQWCPAYNESTALSHVEMFYMNDGI